MYRHAHAFGLFEKRKRNVRAALERIIEKAGDVEVTAAAVVTAVQAYAKINTQGLLAWTEQGNRKLIIRVSRNVCCSEAGVQHAAAQRSHASVT